MSPNNGAPRMGGFSNDNNHRPINNADLVADAGKVHLDEAQMWGKGIIGDFKRTVGTHWFSEVLNFNQKTIPVSLLMFITVIAPTLTFGAVYGKVTNNLIGAIETILATSWIGIVYSLIGGMPMVSSDLVLFRDPLICRYSKQVVKLISRVSILPNCPIA